MNASQERIIRLLIERGSELFKQPYKEIAFTGTPEADDLLNDVERFPHAFVLACIMDRQIRAERAWIIPYQVSRGIGGFEFPRLLELDRGQFKEIFVRRNLQIQ